MTTQLANLSRIPPAEEARDTALAIMSRDVVALQADLTVDDAIEELRQQAEGLFYAYVVDASRRLLGVLSVRDLVLSRPQVLLKNLMRRNVVTLGVETDQSRVVEEFRRHRFAALPVVDEKRRLLGVVKVDDAMAALERETTQDVQRMFGAGADEGLDSPWQYSFRKRMPWLLVNLALTGTAASVVNAFDATVAAWTVLAVYLPVVAGMGGNASAQAMAVAIRGIAIGEARRRIAGRLLIRELWVGAASGLTIGILAAATSLVLHQGHGPALPLLVGVALFINHTIACVWGASMPLLMRSLGFDPAQSATIFTTTLTDFVGFLALLSLAALVLKMAA